MPTLSGFAPPIGRSMAGGNQCPQRPVTPDFETLVPRYHPRVTEPSMPALRDSTGRHRRSPPVPRTTLIYFRLMLPPCAGASS
jgi:hypothetical protein